jgi:flagellar biosynthesis protein
LPSRSRDTLLKAQSLLKERRRLSAQNPDAFFHLQLIFWQIKPLKIILVVDMKKAVALRYKMEKDRAPLLVAKGQGQVAEKIIEIASKHNIPIHIDPDLALILSKLNLDEEIPPSLYNAVASVIAFVWSIEKRSSK